jgi:predicted transcriptional regulator
VSFLVRGFRTPAQALAAHLGPLEQQVLEAVWAHGGPASVRDVQVRVPDEPAYTTIMTTLTRLVQKRLLQRERIGRAFLYRAVLSREQLSAGVAGGMVDALLQGCGAGARPVLSGIVDAVGARDREMLDELERLIRDKQRELDEGEER